MERLTAPTPTCICAWPRISSRTAQSLPNPNDKDRVDRLLRRAQVDAELSLALARGEDQKAAAQAAIDKVTKLNREATK